MVHCTDVVAHVALVVAHGGVHALELVIDGVDALSQGGAFHFVGGGSPGLLEVGHFVYQGVVADALHIDELVVLVEGDVRAGGSVGDIVPAGRGRIHSVLQGVLVDFQLAQKLVILLHPFRVTEVLVVEGRLELLDVLPEFADVLDGFPGSDLEYDFLYHVQICPLV